MKPRKELFSSLNSNKSFDPFINIDDYVMIDEKSETIDAFLEKYKIQRKGPIDLMEMLIVAREEDFPSRLVYTLKKQRSSDEYVSFTYKLSYI